MKTILAVVNGDICAYQYSDEAMEIILDSLSISLSIRVDGLTPERGQKLTQNMIKLGSIKDGGEAAEFLTHITIALDNGEANHFKVIEDLKTDSTGNITDSRFDEYLKAIEAVGHK